jgi:hypothetical protein
VRSVSLGIPARWFAILHLVSPGDDEAAANTHLREKLFFRSIALRVPASDAKRVS